ncbi:hypothetical protein [Pseudomonas aeruginosa]|uniref:hypothetical protein n=1 Tax=Pseudomonas aeruginosa TaxID=287 RepID=UPI0034E09DB9
MKTQILAAHAVRAGMQVYLAGSFYAVESNLFDRHGKAPNQALTILECSSQETESGYGAKEHFGLLPSTPVVAIRATA